MSAAGARRIDPVTRHRVMASIKSKDTKPELALRRALRAAGLLGYRLHANLPGRPDVVFTRWRVAVFVDGVWWHGHPAWYKVGIRGPYWDHKISGNRARDRRVDDELAELSWCVLRFWDVDVLAHSQEAADEVARALTRMGRRVERPIA